jgi:hypothetical protein
VPADHGILPQAVPVMTLVPVVVAARSASTVRPDQGGGDLRHRGRR